MSVNQAAGEKQIMNCHFGKNGTICIRARSSLGNGSRCSPLFPFMFDLRGEGTVAAFEQSAADTLIMTTINGTQSSERQQSVFTGL